MNERTLRCVLLGYVALLAPVAWIAMLYDRYIIDGDAVAYMDIADLLHAHHWSGAVNAYWHPLYPAMLWMAQVLMHPSRANELGAYYVVNFVIFLLQVAAMLGFVSALVRLRERMSAGDALLPVNLLRLLGLGLLVIAMTRELSLGRVRPDALLQALILAAMAMMLLAFATERWMYAPAMGLLFGLAYLTKSFAFVLALVAIAVMILFQWLVQKRGLGRSVASGALALVAFGVVAGPYVAALSKQKGRLDFGDSGALNYAWYVGGTEKMHLEPWMTGSFGSATVMLKHPETQLMAAPGVYSYKALGLGTYPPWFDATYFNEHIVPHVRVGDLARHDVRTLVQVLRYLLNHPEPLVLLALLLVLGAKAGLLGTRFWWPPVALGLAMWGLYGLVNVEERYVTVAYLVVLLPLFAALRLPRVEEGRAPGFPASALSATAAGLVLLFAFLAMTESLRESAELRRSESVEGLPHGWYKPSIFGGADGLRDLGVKPGDEVACIGTMACLNDHYWARLAGVRVLTEMYDPDPHHLIQHLDAMPNREDAYSALHAQGARVLVGMFDPGEMTPQHPAATGWLRLGETNYYALPLR